MKFKKGDIVRRIKSNYGNVKIGDTFEVDYIDSGDNMGLVGKAMGVMPCYFELVEPSLDVGEQIVTPESVEKFHDMIKENKDELDILARRLCDRHLDEGIVAGEQVLRYTDQVELYQASFHANDDETENERLRNLLTSIYECDSMCKVRRIIQEEISREETDR